MSSQGPDGIGRAHGRRRLRGRLPGIAALAAVAPVGGLVTACGGDDEDAAGEGEGGRQSGSTTLTFLNAQDPSTFDTIVAAFERANPDIKIKLQTLPFDDLNAAVQSRLGSKDSSIDLYEFDEPRVAAFAARGFLAELDDLRRQAEGKIDPQALDITTYEDKQYAMPRWTSSQLLYYDRDLLKKAGVEEPSSDPAQPMTWEQVVEDGRKAQDAGAKWGMVFDQIDRYYQLQPP